VGQLEVILLDTHVVVWLALDQTRISNNARLAIERARASGGGLAISAISLFETAILHKKARIALNGTLETFLAELETRFLVLPINGRVCVSSLSLPRAYPDDPADRIIGATALVEGIPLLTADSEIRRSKALPTIW
jgi:PIN domain nuclease of toxin-antitoxin system